MNNHAIMAKMKVMKSIPSENSKILIFFKISSNMTHITRIQSYIEQQWAKL